MVSSKIARRRRVGITLATGLLTGICLVSSNTLMAGIVILGNELPPEPMTLDHNAKQELAYGEVLFDFYGEKKFNAMTQLVAGKKSGLFDDDSSYQDLLLGELYVDLGLSQQAEEIFDRLLKKDILSQLRAETWLKKATLDYRRNQYDTAAKILSSDRVDGLPVESNAARHLMLANIRIHQEEFGDALSSLYSIPPGTREGLYATYNMGVAMIRSNHIGKGIQLLHGVMNLPEGTTETNALKDRAALTVGLAELKQRNFDASRAALIRIRADGPFSNEALLALGLTNFERQEFKRALPLWLELVRRNPSHQSVQEALMLAPRAYEELHALPQALAGYEFAAQTYRSELKQVEVAIRDIDHSDWLDKLIGRKEHEQIALDPMAPLHDYSAHEGPEMAYLYKLFASHDFAENFRKYNELQRLRAILTTWLNELPALEQTYANQQAQLQAVMPSVRNKLISAKRNHQAISEKSAILASNIPTTLDMRKPADLASFSQLQLWEIGEVMDKALATQPQTRATSQYRERLRRVKGLLLYDIAHDAPKNRTQQFNDVAAMSSTIEITAIRVEAVEQGVRDAVLHIRGDLGSRMGSKRQQIEKMISTTNDLLTQLGQILRNDALRVLASSRLQLGNQLGEAHLSIARLQDASVVQKIEQGAKQ